MSEKEKYVSNLLEPMKEDIEKFTDGILDMAKETDDTDRMGALLIYAMSIKSFARSGNWRRAVVNIMKFLKAKSKKEKEDKMESDKYKTAEEAWLFIDKRLPELLDKETVDITEDIPLGIVNCLMMEFAMHCKNNTEDE